MNINVNQNLTSNANLNQNKQTEIVVNTSSVSEAIKNVKTAMILSSLVQGQSISGQISDISGDSLILNLGNNVELSAKISSNINLQVGQTVLFEVKSNQNNKLSLSPLFTNASANETTVVNALKAADLSVTDENVAMVRTMMQEGMSIDKESLLNMSRLSASFTSVSASSVVELTAMGVEVNQGNLEQLEAYHNMRYQIMDTTDNLSNEIQQIWQSYSESGEFSKGLEFMQKALQIFAEESASALTKEQAISQIQDENINEPSTSISDQTGGRQTNVDLDLLQNENVQKTVSDIASQKTASETLQEISGRSETVATEVENHVRSEVLQIVKNADPETIVMMLKNGNLKGQELADAMNDMIAQGALKREDVELLYQSIGKEFQKSFMTQILNQWNLEPESTADKETVKEFYQSMQKQTQGLLELLQNNGKSDSEAGKSITNLRQNLDFMHAMNQVFPYIQIPMKQNMQNAHGDLYVYTNTKKKHSDDGSVSALLHLEMPNLGNLDIYVRLQNQNVSTHFYLEDDSLIDFLEGHMELLQTHLSKKGYQLNSEVTARKETEKEVGTGDVINHIRGKEAGDRLISVTAFDARA